MLYQMHLHIPPPIAPQITAQIIGFLRRKFAPYIAGSVIPNSAVILPDNATVFNDLFFDFKNTPIAAPACEKFAAPANANKF